MSDWLLIFKKKKWYMLILTSKKCWKLLVNTKPCSLNCTRTLCIFSFTDSATSRHLQSLCRVTTNFSLQTFKIMFFQTEIQTWQITHLWTCNSYSLYFTACMPKYCYFMIIMYITTKKYEAIRFSVFNSENQQITH